MRKLYMKVVFVASLVTTVSGPALAWEPGYLVPISNTNCPFRNIAGDSTDYSAVSKIELSISGTTTWLTLTENGIYDTTLSIGGFQIPYVETVTPYNVMLGFDSSNNTVSAYAPTFNGSGQQTGIANSTGTYTGSISSNGFGGWFIAVAAHFTGGANCNLTGETLDLGS